MKLFEEISAAAELPLNRAVTLPAAAYTDPGYFHWECGELLAADWICVGHSSQIPQPGDFFNCDILGDPLVVVRGKDSAIRCLSRRPHSSRSPLRAVKNRHRLSPCQYYDFKINYYAQ